MHELNEGRPSGEAEMGKKEVRDRFPYPLANAAAADIIV